MSMLNCKLSKQMKSYCGKFLGGLINRSLFNMATNSFERNAKCPKQYCVSYARSFRLTLKHCAYDPNSIKLPFIMPEGIFAHASNTKIKRKIFKLNFTNKRN